ncbi:hypothetical protein PoB_002797600 [Plakobranchus ocellatus]|uniref:Uncharacterized protein n=1 Tax=Plakobranchus ocellatus TaxID=259542 RepID=A0AAV4A464_9GAST|nr:hypothetical protein PoB_002797600 [Plakobranchus ocellatus]
MDHQVSHGAGEGLIVCQSLAITPTLACFCPSCRQIDSMKRCTCCVYRLLGKRSEGYVGLTAQAVPWQSRLPSSRAFHYQPVDGFFQPHVLAQAHSAADENAVKLTGVKPPLKILEA